MSWIQSDLQQSQSAYVPPEWGTGSDAEIIEALEKHYAGEVDLTEYWSVGDTRTINVSAMANTHVGESQPAQELSFVISEVGGKTLSDGITECAFQVDLEWGLEYPGYMNSTATNTGGWGVCDRRNWCNDEFYNSIPSTIRSIFKQHINQYGVLNTSTYVYEILNSTDYFSLRSWVEISGTEQISSSTYTITGEGTQIEYYKTSSNRLKNRGKDGVPNVNYNRGWWLRSIPKNSDSYFVYIDMTGDGSTGQANSGTYIVISPFGVI